MPNYQNGKIYCIRSPHTDKVYIGSTTRPLSQRLSKHKCPMSNETVSSQIIDAGDAYIELIEEFPCDNKEQLNKREGEIIRETTNCINKRNAGTMSEAEKICQRRYNQKRREETNRKRREIYAKKKSALYTPTENVST